MKITSDNSFPNNYPDLFYKATAGGVQKCIKVCCEDSIIDIEPTWGYVVDSLFIKTISAADHFHFDHPNQGFFTTEQEAIELHRELVLNYINGLNASSLKTCPIVTG